MTDASDEDAELEDLEDEDEPEGTGRVEAEPDPIEEPPEAEPDPPAPEDADAPDPAAEDPVGVEAAGDQVEDPVPAARYPDDHVGLLVRVRSNPRLAWHDGRITAEDELAWTVTLDRPCTRPEWTSQRSSFAANGRVTFTRVNKQVETFDPGGLLEPRLDDAGELAWDPALRLPLPEPAPEPALDPASEPTPEGADQVEARPVEEEVPPARPPSEPVRWNESMARTQVMPARAAPVRWNESMDRPPAPPAQAAPVRWNESMARPKPPEGR